MSHPLRVGIALLVALVLSAADARAWVEVRQLGDEVKLTVDRAGKAQVAHRVTLRIAGGPLRVYEVRGVDEDAVFDGDGWVALQRDAQNNSLASAVSLGIEMTRERRVGGAAIDLEPVARIRLGDKGVGRGTWVIAFSYTTDLMARGIVKVDGSTARIRWSGPSFADGFESARATFVLPTAPTEPQVDESAIHADTGEPEPNTPTFLSTLKRTSAGDELSLLRPYAPKNEPVAWPVRADARAFGRPREPEAPPPLVPMLPVLTDAFGAGRQTLGLAVGGGAFLLYALLIVLKSREVARGARAAGVVPSPLVPMPMFVRAPVAGLCLVGGLWLQLLLDRATIGASFVAISIALAVHRTPRWKHAARGPGRWLPVTAREAFEDLPRHKGALLDVSTRAGKVLFVLALVALAATTLWLARFASEHAALVALDAPVLFALFCTGRLRELPPDAVAGRAPLLAAVAKRLPRHLPRDQRDGVRVVPRIRVPASSADADELRLLVAPRRPLPGFGGIEVGVVFVPGAGGAIAMPEVLVRFTAGSECDRALASTLRRGRVLRGRRPDEKVLLVSPRLPTARMTAAIAAALAVRTRAPDEKPAAPEAAPERARRAKHPTRAAA